MTLYSLDRENADLRRQLDRVIARPVPRNSGIDVVVTLNEVNDRHGTGPLVQRVLASRRRILSIRARFDYGIQEFGEWSAILSHKGKTTSQIREDVQQALGDLHVDRVLCVPYEADQLLTSIAIHDLCQAPVCTWIMDDQNIAAHRIPDAVMREALTKSSLRLATHPELCRAYERKFGLPFFILPAVVPERLLCRRPCAAEVRPLRAALVGSIWEQSWFDQLCRTLEGSGLAIDWFGNHRSPWVHYREADLARAGIHPHGVVPEERLAEELRRYSFAIVPVSPLDGSDSNPGIATLSLPGRILFIAAASNTPTLVIGGEATCGAHFVKHFGIGEVIPYRSASFLAAAERLSLPETQAAMRSNATRLAPALSDQGISDWLLQSTRRAEPADQRFQQLFCEYLEGR
jgi:hypothetical protein